MKKKRFNKQHKRGRLLKADEYFKMGPFEMARFGAQVVMRNNMTHAQHAEYIKFHANRLPQVVSEINSEIGAIVSIVKRYDPIQLLHRAYFELAASCINKKPENGETGESVYSQRMIDYIQSIAAAVRVDSTPLTEVSEADWDALSGSVEAVFNKINHDYVLCRTSLSDGVAGAIEKKHQEFYVQALLMWCNVTGHRYEHQEIDYLRRLISPHSAVLQRLWGIDSEGLLIALGRILVLPVFVWVRAEKRLREEDL